MITWQAAVFQVVGKKKVYVSVGYNAQQEEYVFASQCVEGLPQMNLRSAARLGLPADTVTKMQNKLDYLAGILRARMKLQQERLQIA